MTFIGFLIVANMTLTVDIPMHDNYVVEIVAECHVNNVSTFCEGLREKFNCPRNDQLCLGKAYWDTLAQQAVFIGIIMFSIRMSFAYMLQRYLFRPIRVTSVLIATIWGLIVVIIFMFGFLDLMYYAFQPDREKPQTLDWLDGAGVFTVTREWTGTLEHVELSDLYLTTLAGLANIGFFIFVTMYIYAEQHFKRRNIA